MKFRRDALTAAEKIRDAAHDRFQTAPQRMYGTVFAELCERRIQAAARRDAALAALKEAEDAYQAIRWLQGDVVTMGARWPAHLGYGLSNSAALTEAQEIALWRPPGAQAA